MLFHVEPQFYSGEIPIIPDIIHVSVRDREDAFEDDHLVQRSSQLSALRLNRESNLVQPKEFRIVTAVIV